MDERKEKTRIISKVARTRFTLEINGWYAHRE
jgi:hypothetical protein